MRKTKKIIASLIILCMAITLMPFQVFATQSYTLTFTVSGNHTITTEGRTGEIIIDGVFVNYCNGSNEGIGVASVAQDGKSATIYVEDGTAGSFRYHVDDEFTLYVNGNPLNFDSEFSSDTAIAVQDYEEPAPQGGQQGGDSMIPLFFQNGVVNGNNIEFTVGGPDTKVTATAQGVTVGVAEWNGSVLEIDRNHLNDVTFALSDNFNEETMGVYVKDTNNNNGFNASLTVNNKVASFNGINLPGGDIYLRIGLKADNDQGSSEHPEEPTHYFIDFGTAAWTVREQDVTATIAGKNIVNQGPIFIGVDEKIVLTGFDERIMQVTIKDKNPNGPSVVLAVENNNGVYETCLANKPANINLGADGTYDFVVERRQNQRPENNRPEPNTAATVTVKSSNGQVYTYVDAMLGINGYPIEIPGPEIDPNTNEPAPTPESVTIENVGYLYNEEEDNGKVTINCAALFIKKYVGTVTINGTAYNVDDYIDYTNRNEWLDAYSMQTVAFNIPNVPKADEYEIICDLADMPGENQYIGNFLWTDDEEHKNEDLYIGHSILEVVRVKYWLNDPVTGEEYEVIVEEEDLENDPYIEYYPYGEVGSLVCPDFAECTARITPDYGYQVTSFGINGSDIITGDEISVFTFPIHRGNFHLNATVTKVDDKVDVKSEKVKSGTIKLGGKEINSGSVVLSVDDVELSDEQISNFEETAEGYTISSYLNINLDQVIYKGTADDVWSNELRDLNNEATITLKLEEGVDGNEVVIVHEKHDGTYEIIPTIYDEATNTITFKTKSFSNYAIASKANIEETQEDNDREDIISPKTGDNIILWIGLAAISSLGILATVKNIKK